LYHPPQLLILDEINPALDRLTERFMLNLLVKLKENIAIIFITTTSCKARTCIASIGRI
jgi:ATP-binding cassette subfamily B protein